MTYTELIQPLAQKNDKRIVLLVLDGVGGIHTEAHPQTALEQAKTPNLDALTKRSALGRSLPVDVGITPGSGPGHLGLFGYDPSAKKHQIGRGVLEALGIDYKMQPGEIAARGNFATIDADGKIADRRAGRPSTEECERITKKLGEAISSIGDVSVKVLPVQEHRFCVIFNGEGLDPDLLDTDPQKTGVEPLPATPRNESAATNHTASIVQQFIDQAFEVLNDEDQINGLTLRGFSSQPDMPTFEDLYHLSPAAVAYYPLYRGVATLAGMEILNTGPTPAEQFATVTDNWDKHDYFFIHIKKTDSSGEDGNFAAKIKAIEAVDAALPSLLKSVEENGGVLAITGDHSTPCVMKGHSWHPVPLLVFGPNADIDATDRYTETQAIGGSIGDIQSDRLLGLLLANAGKLGKYGA